MGKKSGNLSLGLEKPGSGKPQGRRAVRQARSMGMTEMDDNAESSIYRELREVRASWEETNREIRGLLGWL